MGHHNKMFGSGFVKTTSILFLITLALKILGLFREILMASYIGMNETTDAYNIALLMVSLITGVSGTAIGSSLIPVLVGIVGDCGERKKERFFINAFWTLMTIAFTVAIMLYIFAIPVISVIAPGFNLNTVHLSADIFQLGFININAIVAATLFTQYLNLKKSFYLPMFAASIGTLLLVGYLVVAGTSANVRMLMIMTVSSCLIQVFCMLPSLFKQGLRFSLYLNLKDSNLFLFFSLALPAAINYMAQQIGIVINRALATQLVVGSVSALSYANSIVMMINMTVSLSIATVIFPRMAEALHVENIGKAILVFRQGILLACILLFPAAVGIFILAVPICSVLFERGVFTSENSTMTAAALCGYSFGVVAYALFEISNRFFNSLKDTKTPMITAFVGVTIMVIMSFVLHKPLQLYGLSLAASIMYIVMAMMLFIRINNKHAKIFDKALLLNFLRIAIASFIMGTVLYSLRNTLLTAFMGGLMDLTAKIVIGIIVYVASLALFSIGIRKEDYMFGS